MEYTIRESSGLSHRDDIAELAGRQHLIVDSGAAHHGRELARRLAERGIVHRVYPVRGGEGCKTLPELQRLCDEIQLRAQRRDLVVVVGGGAVTDLARCVAAWLWKGMPLAIVPTTPTAYVDAGIGVKGAVNRDDRKNSIGVYYPPLLVALDLGLLRGCPADVLRAGLMEVMKMALIDGGRFWELYERSSPGLLATGFQGPDALPVTRAAITSMLGHLQPNLREHELSRPVDLGHLLVGPLEMRALLPHGLAVGIDLALMLEYAAVLGLLAEDERDRAQDTIRAVGAPLCHELLTPELVQGAIEDTRRQRDGVLNLPVPERIGTVRVHPHVDGAAMREAVLRLRVRGLGASTVAVDTASATTARSTVPAGRAGSRPGRSPAQHGRQCQPTRPARPADNEQSDGPQW
ncbi:iron-containing alcohol dehydrogenase [Plantactinospora sonchi]|uniref:Iron-containing alcohol dehydrogenase n=1 Tax=Plantactinospora sonchi TaxID=1544735 RepID=A0ABU7S4T6_9ACTN